MWRWSTKLDRSAAWAVELRKQFPKEFEEVEIMTQPSSNCDGVLLAWIVEEQCEEEICSLWIRDCFSAVFQEQVVQRQFTGCQASAQILGKMTQQLQLTDTDFAKSFKASFRKQLEEQRLAAKKGGTEYKIGYKEIILATVGAQRDAVQRQVDKDWIVGGSVRNGLIAFKASPEEGKLVPFLDESWAKERGLAQGSKRIPNSWLELRFSWVKDGIPLPADFALSCSATQVADLIEWSYKNPSAEDEDGDADGGGDTLDISNEDEIATELQVPLWNSLFLRMSPDLRRAHIRRKAQQDSWQELVKLAIAKAKMKAARQAARKAALRLSFAEIRNKLAKMSKREAMADIVPVAQAKAKAKGKLKPSAKLKPSLVLKASCKAKPSVKEKGSLVKKELAKNSKKSAKDKAFLLALKDDKKSRSCEEGRGCKGCSRAS